MRRNFRYLGETLDELGIDRADGIMFDLGVSSYQLDTPERGFSYQHDGPLDMRMDTNGRKNARDVVNTYSEADLYRIIKDYGEERWAGRIANFIVTARQEAPISRTEELVRIIKKPCLQGPGKTARIRQSGPFRPFASK